MVCVVGRMRDLILQLSKSSIYSTKPFTGYVANEPQQNSQTIQGIIMMFSLLPMVSYFISAYLVRYFKLNNAFLEKIKTDLAKRELEKGRD
ncbi:GPH family transporter [Klebsiella quasipneumoniae]|nr:GPH family transporter [Klebsiella quasipneumoniae]